MKHTSEVSRPNTIVQLLLQQHNHYAVFLLAQPFIGRVLQICALAIVWTSDRITPTFGIVYLMASALITVTWFVQRRRLNMRVFEIEELLTHKIAEEEDAESARLYVQSRYQRPRWVISTALTRYEPIAWFLLSSITVWALSIQSGFFKGGDGF